MVTKACRVLAVDDFPDSVEMSCALLRRLGCEARGATTGRAALALASEFDPDVAILDIELPDIDGYQLASELRGQCRHAIYIVALTGHGLPADRRRAAAAGFDRFLVKPIAVAAFRELIASA
jgi:two-component system, chemotaxis family, CheB/CheR fusion protein